MDELITSEKIISVIVAIVIGYTTAYLAQKAKNRALKEDNKTLELEKVSLVHDFNQKLEKSKKEHSEELENVKKEHSLDIQKRKYKYESKQKQYYDLMSRLDNFNACQLDIIQKDLRNIMTSYYQSIHSGSTETVAYNELALDAIAKIRNQQAELFSQLNAFKLSTNSMAIGLIECLCLEVTKSGENLQNCITYISGDEFRSNGGQVPDSYLKVNGRNQLDIVDIKSELLKVLKADLELM